MRPFFLPERFVVSKSEPAVAPAKKRVLTPKQWAEIEALWESGTVIYADLVKKYGKAQSTFERHFAKKKIVKGAKAEVTKKRVEEKLAVAAVTEATVTAARITETKEQHYRMAQGLASLAWAEVIRAQRDKVPLASITANMKAIDLALSAVKKAREERYAVLGLDRPDAVDPDELPELVISELTAAQVQELRDRDHTELDDLKKAQEDGVDIHADLDDEDDGVVDEGS